VKRKVLLADDSPTTEKVVQLCFNNEPYEIRAVQNGDEALELLEAWKPDILLADVLIPGPDGYHLCRRAKEENSIPVILLVGTFEPFDFGQAEEAGYDAYLTKPFDTTQLFQMVKELAGPIVEEPATQTSVLDFQEQRQARKPGLLMVEDSTLGLWDRQITPQPQAAVSAVPQFLPLQGSSSEAVSPVAETISAAGSGADLEREVTEAVDRVAPRLIESFRRELLEQLRRVQ
jgi:CheY-like chemotaxis protein